MRLTCGLEVHAQLLSPHKLFSSTPVAFQAAPNSLVSHFDAALPGTQPHLNKDCLRLALRAAVALGANVQRKTSFDRKHYMYPDQPAGFQITQNFHPYARDGHLDLLPRDLRKSPGELARANDASDTLRVRIRQLQLEQDTGKTVYAGTEAHVDLNRANTALIELVTEPDLPTAEAAGAFVRKLQTLLRHLGVCSGDMETGAMRVDANVSVDFGPRCEIKNLFSPSAIVGAIKAEYRRQVEDIKKGKTIQSETRGWDGRNTHTLRLKDSSVDYRYMPDPEIPALLISPTVVSKVADALPALPDVILDDLIQNYSITPTDARTLFDHGMSHVMNFQSIHNDFISQGGANPDSVANWIVHRWLGETSRLPPRELLTELLLFIDQGKVTTSSGKLVVKHLSGLTDNDLPSSIAGVIEEYGLAASEESSELENIYKDVISKNPDVVTRIRGGKKNSIAFLLGQVMKETQGTVDPKTVRKDLERLILQ